MDGSSAITLSAIITGFLGTLAKMHYDQRQREQQRRWDIEDRQRVADAAQSHNEGMAAAMAENTTLTKVAASKADAAFKEANEVNQKIASLGSGTYRVPEEKP